MCSFLEEVTVNKFVVLNKRKDPNLFKDFNPQNFGERYGGKAPNCLYEEEFCLFPQECLLIIFLRKMKIHQIF